MIHVVYTRRLRRELSQIVETIARDNVPAADAFVERLEHACSLLSTTPAMGPLRPKIGRDIRSLVLGNYLVFYRYRLDRERVDILSVWHSRRRSPRLRR